MLDLYMKTDEIINSGLLKHRIKPKVNKNDRLYVDIENNGIINPIMLRANDLGLFLVDGVQRILIAKDLGIEFIPVKIDVRFIIDESIHLGANR